jgi:menaquinone-dependent protoporphyrinogen oxidase
MGKVLVAYATRAGSTIGVAEAIAQVFVDSGMAADVVAAKNVKSVGDYQAVVVGSATRMGKVLPEAVAFLRRHASSLEDKPLAYFTVCLTLKENTPANRQIVDGYLAPLRQILPPVSTALFAGVLDLGKISPVWRLFFRLDKSRASPEGDYRDWESIRAWAHELVPLFGRTP